MRLIGPEGECIGVKSYAEAMKMAEDLDLDRGEISPTAKPPVCRVMDFSKFKYEKDKKDKEARKKQKVSQVKEVRFRPLIGDHDYQIKIEHAREFLAEGNKVRVRLQFRGREMVFKEKRMAEVFKKITEDLADIAKVEKPVEEMGRMAILFLTPSK